MWKLFVFLLIAGGLWYVQNNYDFSGLKQSALDKMKQEKTINTVNSHRSQTQQDVYNATN